MTVSVLALMIAFWVAAPGSLKALPRAAWLAPATVFGPLLFFGFVHVRFTANALYHRMVRDAYEAGAPVEGNG